MRLTSERFKAMKKSRKSAHWRAAGCMPDAKIRARMRRMCGRRWARPPFYSVHRAAQEGWRAVPQGSRRAHRGRRMGCQRARFSCKTCEIIRYHCALNLRRSVFLHPSPLSRRWATASPRGATDVRAVHWKTLTRRMDNGSPASCPVPHSSVCPHVSRAAAWRLAIFFANRPEPR